MITGHKPNGFFQTVSPTGQRLEGETRMCVHCQYTWIYQPGSGHRRGWCLKCNGLLCGRPACAAQQRRLVASFADQTRSCVPYTDGVERQRDRYAQDPRYQVLPSGIVVRAE